MSCLDMEKLVCCVSDVLAKEDRPQVLGEDALGQVETILNLLIENQVRAASRHDTA